MPTQSSIKSSSPTRIAIAPHRSTRSELASDTFSDDGFSWVLARPFSAWLRFLISETGLPWRVIALACGVPAMVVKNLLVFHGDRVVKKIRAIDAKLLIAMTPEMLFQLAQLKGNRQLVANALIQLANVKTLTNPAKLLGLDPGLARSLVNGGGWCSRLDEFKACAALQAHGLLPLLSENALPDSELAAEELQLTAA